jgi:hypothetical protein
MICGMAGDASMARIKMPLQQRNRPSTDRPITGSRLFPELVWAHWAWQTRSRPHEFPRPPRWARRLLAVTAFMNGRPPQVAKKGAATPPDSEVANLKQAYEDEAREFENSEGPIIRAYWCATEASAVVLTEKKNRLSWLPWRRVGSLALHRATDWVTADAPMIAELLHGGDMLAVRINRVLTAVPRLIAMEWIFSEQSYLLGFVERSGGQPSRKETASTIARHRVEIDRLERYYDRAARKVARIWYFAGMLLGLGAVVGLGALIPFVIELFGHLDLASTSARTFYACFVAGALGAMVSVMTRMRQEEGVRLDYEVGELLIVMLGAFRPVLGAIFGVLAYFAIDSKLLPITPPTTGRQFFYYALFAFVAGFSERFAHVILGSADLTVAKALTGAETPEPVQPNAGVPATGAVKTGRPDRQGISRALVKSPSTPTEKGT